MTPSSCHVEMGTDAMHSLMMGIPDVGDVASSMRRGTPDVGDVALPVSSLAAS
jgi:hypothetical protein